MDSKKISKNKRAITMNINEVLDNRFKAIRRLGSGKKDNVYLVEHIGLNTLWVVKKGTKGEKTISSEVNILKKLRHTGIPMVVDCFDDGKNVYMVEEYFEGYTLENVMGKKGRIPEIEAIDWVEKLCFILSYIHSIRPRPVIHNDIKPSNLIVSWNNTIKLIDFSISSDDIDNQKRFGTIGYAAPEQYGIRHIDRRTDIYSVGVLLLHMLTGSKPQNPLIYNEELLSDRLINIIRRCTAYSPRLRYDNVEELLLDLKQKKIE